MGRSWRVLSPLDRILGSLEALLEPSGALLGASWSLLGCSWWGLGPLGCLSGRLRSDPNDMQQEERFQDRKKTILHHTMTFFCPPFWSQNRRKMAPKTRQKLRRFSRAKKLLFKSLLEPSWADLGAFWRPSWRPNLRSGTRGRVFGEKSRFGC